MSFVQDVDADEPVLVSGRILEHIPHEKEASDEFDYDETMWERFVALTDAFPEGPRNAVFAAADYIVRQGLRSAALGRKLLWAVSSTATVLLVPLALELAVEQRLAETEHEHNAALLHQKQLLQPSLYGSPVQSK